MFDEDIAFISCDRTGYMEEAFCKLTLRSKGKVALVLDASESAEDHWDEILELARYLLDNLGSDVEREIYFLSNGKVYAPSHLARSSHQWRKENLKRGSFITPIFEHLSPDTDRVLVIGTGPIYDLEDWQKDPLFAKLLLIRVNDRPLQQEEMAEEVVAPEPASVLARLHRPIRGVKITGNGFMPYFWDNPGYRLRLEGKGEKVLLEATDLQDFSLHLALFYEGEVIARLKRGDGTEEEITLPKQSEAKVVEEWRELPADERAIFERAIKGKPFTCLLCGQEHPWETLVCYESRLSILGRPIYPSWEGMKGFVILRRRRDDVQYRPHPVEVMRIGDGQVAIVEGSTAFIYRYISQRWLQQEEMRPYFPLGEEEYCVAI